MLLEVIGPELQSIYDDKQIEVCVEISIDSLATLKAFSIALDRTR